MINNDWQKDPRLQNLDPAKLAYLNEFALHASQLSKGQILPTFLSLQAEAGKRGIQFSDEETALLVSVLAADMSPADKKRLDTLRFFAKKLAARSS